MLMPQERLYKKFKNICYDKNVVSQVVIRNTYRKLSVQRGDRFAEKNALNIAFNVLKQMNSKLGGDLFYIQFSKELQMRTMLIGIDVCHSGPTSIVGFCASINREMSQYYSEKIS